MSRNVYFLCIKNGAAAPVTRRRFDNAAFRAYTNVTVMSQNITFETVIIHCFHLFPIEKPVTKFELAVK